MLTTGPFIIYIFYLYIVIAVRFVIVDFKEMNECVTGTLISFVTE